MKKFNIYNNRPEPESGEIAAGKNFNKVLEGASKFSIPMYKKPSFIFSAAASAVLIAGAIFYYGSKENKVATQKFINPPVADLNIKNVSYSIDVTNGGEIVTTDGTKIQIPSDAFVDKNGNNVVGKVDITYRGFHDQTDLLLSGIPMDYDSGGTKYVFSSAGMVDINGYSNGDPVFIKDGKSLNVSILSDFNDDKYNLYQLDTVNKKWICKGKDKVTALVPDSKDEHGNVAKDTPSTYTIAEELKHKKRMVTNVMTHSSQSVVAPPQKPMEPMAAQTGKLKIHLDVDPQEFPELALYKTTVFEVQEENANEAASDKITWTDAKLTESNTEGIYLLNLQAGTRNVRYHVKPVFEGKDLQMAQKEYKKKFAQYLAVKAEYEKREAEKIADMEKERLAYEKEMAEASTNLKKRDSINFKYSDAQNKVNRVFAIANFGIWNCDCAGFEPKGARINSATYKTKDGSNIKIAKVFLLVKNWNSIFPATHVYSFEYDPRKSTMMVIISRENQIYVYPYDEFAKIPASTRDFTFYMNEPEGKLATVEDARKFMGI